MSYNKYCVTQVNVKWKQMQFTVVLTYIDDVKEVKKKVKTVFQKQKCCLMVSTSLITKTILYVFQKMI